MSELIEKASSAAKQRLPVGSNAMHLERVLQINKTATADILGLCWQLLPADPSFCNQGNFVEPFPSTSI